MTTRKRKKYTAPKATHVLIPRAHARRFAAMMEAEMEASASARTAAIGEVMAQTGLLKRIAVAVESLDEQTRAGMGRANALLDSAGAPGTGGVCGAMSIAGDGVTVGACCLPLGHEGAHVNGRPGRDA